MNKEELRQLTESYYRDVYDYESIDEELTPLGKRAKSVVQTDRLDTARGDLDSSMNKLKKLTGVTRQSANRAASNSEHQVRHGYFRESQDLYDTVLEHLITEGYADDVRAAQVIMTHMSDEWLGDILDEGFKSTGYYDRDYDPYDSREPDPFASTATTRQGRAIKKRVRALSQSNNPEDIEKATFIHNAANARGNMAERGLAKARRNRSRGPGPRAAKNDALRDMRSSGFA